MQKRDGCRFRHTCPAPAKINRGRYPVISEDGMKTDFDPFQDRAARDIRNTLSTAFRNALKDEHSAPFEAAGKHLLQQEIAEGKQAYILDRLGRYRKCFADIRRKKIKTVLEQAFILWDEGLFFEVHEILEGLWIKAEGRQKSALQGLIRAAGFYILLEGGRRQGAEKMAARAVQALQADLTALPYFPAPALLLAKLRDLDPVPPKLLDCR